MDDLDKIAHDTPGVKYTQTIAGQSFLLNAYGSNFGSMFVILDSFANRQTPDLRGPAILKKLMSSFNAGVSDAAVTVFPPPPVRGVGRAGGFQIMVEDRGDDKDPLVLQGQTENLVEKGNKVRLETSSEGFDLRLMSWGDGSKVPTSGNNLVILGTDDAGRLHIRIFDAGGNLVADTNEKQLPLQAGAISNLKRRLPGASLPLVPTAAEKARIIAEATSIANEAPPLLTGLFSVFAPTCRSCSSTSIARSA